MFALACCWGAGQGDPSLSHVPLRDLSYRENPRSTCAGAQADCLGPVARAKAAVGVGDEDRLAARGADLRPECAQESRLARPALAGEATGSTKAQSAASRSVAEWINETLITWSAAIPQSESFSIHGLSRIRFFKN